MQQMVAISWFMHIPYHGIALQHQLKLDMLVADADACLNNRFGSICCALGNCKGMPACPSKLGLAENVPGAVLQLVTRNLPQPQCK